MTRTWPGLALAATLSAAPAPALAHLDLVTPVSRYGPDVLKAGPCGVEGGERSDNVTVFEPGQTIEIRWVEYIQHPGHYRIAFDEDGDDDFEDPSTMTELYSNETVLLDGIEDTRELSYQATVTLPDVTCDNCTLQVIQVMYDKPPYATPGNDIYYQCADLILREGGEPDPEVEPPMPMEPDPAVPGEPDPFEAPQTDGSGGCTASRGSGGWWFVCLLLWTTRRLARPHELTV
mgnify:CR=1 FL=1